MDTFKKTEYSPIYKVFTEVFNRQNSTFHSCNYRSSRPEVFCKILKVFLIILQNLQENTCARVSLLIKLQAL